MKLAIPRHIGFTLLLIAVAWVIADCGIAPAKVSLSDARIGPMLKAMEEVDRADYGFTPIATNAQISLEVASGGAYDAMLHVYDDTSRTIAFQKTPTGYRWISEQEIHQGPGWFQSVDGTFREYIVVEYQTEKVNGIPTNHLWITYTGDNTNLAGGELSLNEVQPVLALWKTATVLPKPPDLPGAGGFEPLALIMIGILLVAMFVIVVACCLVIGLAILATILVGTGIVSASIIVGFLCRSVSAGFRALFLLVGALLGIIGGIIGTLLTQSVWNSPLRWIVGIAAGLFAGLIVAWLFNRVWSFVVQKLTIRFKRLRK